MAPFGIKINPTSRKRVKRLEYRHNLVNKEIQESQYAQNNKRQTLDKEIAPIKQRADLEAEDNRVY